MWTSALKSFQSNITSNYKVADNPSAAAGAWRIYDATNKTSGKPASVFVFDKKSLDSPSGGLVSRNSAASLKRVHEEVVERLKREASSLARLRHPSILELVEPVEETRSGGLTFATELVTAPLSGLLKEKDEQERAAGIGARSSRYVVDGSDGKGKRRREVEIDELEIQKGLLQIGKGLEFLHESAGLVHGNLTPDAIFINAKGDWKISGLGFAGKSENSTATTSVPSIALSEVLNYDARLPRSVQINFDFTSPDFIMDKSTSSAADMFSLGLLVVALYNSPHLSPLGTNMSVSTYQRIFASASSVPNQSNNYMSSVPLPRGVSTLLPHLLARRPAQRFNAREFQQADYFDNILVSTIRFLESLPAKTPNEKSQFLRGLPRIVNQFPKSVLEKKVLPALLEEMKDCELIALILQNVFVIIKTTANGTRAFAEKVIPRLREVFLPSKTRKGDSTDRDSSKEAGLMVLLENMSIVAENTNGTEFKEDIWPIIHLAMESPTYSLVDTSLATLPVVLSILDFSTIKNDIFPVISAVFSKTSSLGIKIRGLEALQTLCGGTRGQDSHDDDGLDGFDQSQIKRKEQSVILDKYTIQEKVVPLIKGIKTKEPAVMMAALDVLKEVGKIADTDFLANDIMPVLWAFSLGPLLNLQQFQAFMALNRSLATRIEQEQTRKLQDLSSTSAAVANRNDFLSTVSAGRTNGVGSTDGDGVDFESLVLGRKKHNGDSTPNIMGNAFDGWGTSQSSSSRPNDSRFQSQQNTTSLPAFSWSTPSQPNKTTRPNTLSNNSPARGITPDQPLHSFTALQPSAANLASSSSQILQPSRPTTGAHVSQASHTIPTNNTIDWSSASTRSNWSTNSNFTNSPAISTTNNVWTQPQRSASNPSYQQPSQPLQPTFSIVPPPASPYAGFALSPPPSSASQSGSAGRGMNQPINQQQQKLSSPGTNGQKQGLDKYESLI